jgi:alanyl-tRNA synthetase
MASPPTNANELRRSFTGFFAARDHAVVPSASLIPHDPTVLFTVAGMVPFKPYFTGDEVPPFRRATDVQKCARAGGKHNDLDDVGRTRRHTVFFEMMGNFSFGDYFKEKAIPWAWEYVTEDLGLDGDRIWITVHTSDDEAEQIWHDAVGVPIGRIQRLGDADNFWQMGDTGPCGPCSELHIDRGASFGPDGGPLADPAGERFMEFWNLVFMQYDQAPDGTRTPLPRPSIDTGAGLERILTLLQGVDSVWDTDVLRPIIEVASSLTGHLYGRDERTDVSLRILAEHARSGTMLVNDGVFPSNEDRGYVLRRILRRAIRHAFLLGADKLVMPGLVEESIAVMGEAYPDVVKNRDFITGVITREEERFRQTLRTGLTILEDELAVVVRPETVSARALVPTPTILVDGKPALPGATAFKLHDTFGFPLELTTEITAERGVEVDVDGFNVEMAEQRRRAKEARKRGGVDDDRVDRYRELVEQFGTTEFFGDSDDEGDVRVLAVVPVAPADGADAGTVEVFTDRTPFYAESGGQVGDTGTITTATGRAEVLDTTYALPGLRRHVARIEEGELVAGREAHVAIDAERRRAIRRNHTGTHILHWALRQVLGNHVKQAGSLVAPDRLRFDFSHYAPVTADEIARIEALANGEVLSNDRVRVYETTKAEAEAMGAIAFFGDKYGDVVRVLEAGRNSLELCGGTHVRALGDIGTIKIVSESSIGSNLRRIEAVTGMVSVELLQRDERELSELAGLLATTPASVADGVRRKLDEIKGLQDEIRSLRATAAAGRAVELAAGVDGGLVVARVDDLAPGDLRDLAIAVREQPGVTTVVLGGRSDTGGASLVAALRPHSGVQAAELLRDAAKAVKGGGGGKGDVAVAGGKDPSGVDGALRIAAEAARSSRAAVDAGD